MRDNKIMIKKIALERISKLFDQADKVFSKEPMLADRYVELARNIAMRNRVRIPKELKRLFCRHCYSYWMPSKTVRIRLLKGRKVYYCLKCKHFTRVPYKA